MVLLNKLLPQREVRILHCHHPQLALDVGPPVYCSSLLVGVNALKPTYYEGSKSLNTILTLGKVLGAQDNGGTLYHHP